VAVNCAALPETLLESEPIRTRKGLHRGAVGQRRGRFEMAHAGTIFLDEVGDIPPAMRPKLLRVLQERRSSGSAASRPLRWTCVSARRRPAAAPHGQAGQVPRGFVLPSERIKIDLAAAARPARRHPPLGETSREVLPHRGQAAGSFARRRWRRCWTYRWPGNIRELEERRDGPACVPGQLIRPENLRRR